MREYEKKLPITAEEYRYLWHRMIRSSVSKAIHTQTNYYYDTDDLAMNRLGITYRIREKGGLYTATVKEHGYGHTDCSAETSREIGVEFDDALFKAKGLKLQGELMTERMQLFLEQGIEIDIDKNTYLGTIDYEIEIEYVPEQAIRADEVVRELAETLAAALEGVTCAVVLKRQTSAKSKSSRFFERLQSLRRRKEVSENGIDFKRDRTVEGWAVD